MAQQLKELSNPLEVVDALFALRADEAASGPPGEWGEKAHFVQALGLDDEENFARVPCLNDVELAETIPPFSLVRYRCMVQDVFEPELYISVLEERSEDGSGSARLVTTKYRECSPMARAGKVLQQVGRGGLSQRGAYYCVPLPGETAWARAMSSESVKTQAVPASAARSKRLRGEEDSLPDGGDEEMTDTPAPPPVSQQAKEEAAARAAKRSAAQGYGSEPPPVLALGEPNSDAFGLNFPLPEEERRGAGCSTACIVKLYDDDAESVKICCETIEVLGVLCIEPVMANLGPEVQRGLFPDARSPSTALVPRLHGLFVRKLPFYNPMLPFTERWLTEARLASAYQRRLEAPGVLAAARAAALSLLERALGQDTLAAEYVLMQLASRVFARHGDVGLGRWSMNIARWPEGSDVSQLHQAVSDLVPRAVCLPVTAESLDAGRWMPRKDIDANRLVSGRLQLAAGTYLILDETKMAEGKVGSEGVKALQAIQALVIEQQLPYEFFSCDVRVPLELGCLLASRSASIIKGCDVLMPLRPEAHRQPVSHSATGLEAARLLLGLASRHIQPIRISDEVSQAFSNDFAQARQELPIGTEAGHLWLSLARAHCLSHGESELTLARWKLVKEMEMTRLRRCLEEGLLQPR
eukprot:TRINITY_DN30784_c0_g2_i1.p1 TRINITY_DN30784_c0_g2~~TRINITY_DN30784_c0_g2_i1.p1  ORF type:complete len:641 (-),score=118.73 TRINITY_DN30784_c0_g2_i1:131-2053(-)